jgi:lysophospholipase L1-like esterase
MSIVLEHGKRFRTILGVIEDWLDTVELRRPDAVIVHVGIVDCAPRVFSPVERSAVARLRPVYLRRIAISLAHRMRPRLIRLRGPRPYLAEADFRRGVRDVVDRARVAGVRALVFVNMLVPTDDLEQRSPGFQRHAMRYNAILAEESPRGALMVDFNAMAIEHGGVAAITVDGMHPNPTGHRLLASALLAALDERLNHSVASRNA